MTTYPTHIAAPPGQLYWRKERCQSSSAKVLLRTIGGTTVVGQWYGDLDQFFTAWCPLPANGVPQALIQSAGLKARIIFAFKLIFNPRSIS
jgi:hypothetical protein